MLQSDKNIDIYNVVNIIHNIESSNVDKIAVNLSLKSTNKKIFWIFNSRKLDEKNFTKFILEISKENNFLNIILFENFKNKKKFEYLKRVMKNFRKKIIIISSEKTGNSNDESIFFCKVKKNYSDLESKIFSVIKSI